MKKILVLALVLAPAVLMAQSFKYVFKGVIGTASGAPAIAYLGHTVNGELVFDSTTPVKGVFVFRGTLDHPMKANLLIKHWTSEARPASYSDKIPVYLEKGTITMKSDDSLVRADFTGSQLNIDNQQLMAATRAANEKGDRAMLKEVLKQFIQSHPSSLVSLNALKTLAGAVPEYGETYPLFNGLSQSLKDGYDGKLYAAQLEKVKLTSIGAMAPGFTQNDVNGNPVSLASFRGKYVLIDFWASWCGPCRAENPNVVKMYNRYKDKNFTVLGVSLDQPNAHDKWVKAIADDHLEWTQVSDLKFWKNDAAQKYGVNAIPQNFLLDPAGKIIGKNLRGEDLEKKLAEINHTTAAVAVTDGPDLAALKAAVEANPVDMEAHQQFIRAMKLDNPALAQQYDSWMQQYPKTIAVPLALGKAYYGAERPEAKPYLLKVVAINDTMSDAWQMLAFDADRWGDEKGSREYMAKASAANPANAGYAFYYAMDFEQTDPAKWRVMLQDLVKRFPDNERGAQGLYWLATRSNDTTEKIRVFEQLKTLYLPAKFNWSSSGMPGLFEIYLAKDPAKALALAKEMGNEKEWKNNTTLAENMIQVRKLMTARKWADAETLLASIKLSRFSSVVDMVALLKAQAMHATGHTAAAYDSLALLCSKAPADELYNALDYYGGSLGKNKAQIDADIWKLREARMTEAAPFSLGMYTAGGQAKLSDYKGKVVLLTFWFPGCGPCRGEFPHFETVISKFKGKDVAYVGINVFPEQDAYVVPFMKGTRYSFTPLRGTSDWAAKAYKVRGEPENFLIDADGKIVFTNFRISDPHSERMLDLMISSMLDHKQDHRSM